MSPLRIQLARKERGLHFLVISALILADTSISDQWFTGITAPPFAWLWLNIVIIWIDLFFYSAISDNLFVNEDFVFVIAFVHSQSIYIKHY